MTDTKIVTFTGIEEYRNGIHAMINKEYRKAFDIFIEFDKFKDSTNEKYVKLAEAYAENLGTLVTTLDMIKEDTDKDPVYKAYLSMSKCDN